MHTENNMICSICEKEFDPENATSMPFCSERCKLIDLGRWLDERNCIETTAEEDQEE